MAGTSDRAAVRFADMVSFVKAINAMTAKLRRWIAVAATVAGVTLAGVVLATAAQAAEARLRGGQHTGPA